MHLIATVQLMWLNQITRSIWLQHRDNTSEVQDGCIEVGYGHFGLKQCLIDLELLHIIRECVTELCCRTFAPAKDTRFTVLHFKILTEFGFLSVARGIRYLRRKAHAIFHMEVNS